MLYHRYNQSFLIQSSRLQVADLWTGALVTISSREDLMTKSSDYVVINLSTC